MRIFRRISVLVVVALSTGGLVIGAVPAAAAHVTCGQTITVNTTLDSNVGPCDVGLTIGANNVTLDLNGFTITGNPDVVNNVGVTVNDRTGVTVRNGTITQFDAGVAISGGSGNTVTFMTLSDNRGTIAGNAFGEGVNLFNTTGNTVSYNRITNNGPWGGVSIVRSSNNLIEHNQIVGNNQSASNTSGIRVENNAGFTSNANTIRYNLVQGSGLDGIQLFVGASDNVIVHNQSVQNNRDGLNVGFGANRNVVEDNQFRFNGFGPIAGHGIRVRGPAGNLAGAAQNQFRRNVATNNNLFDIREDNPNCGTNVWRANQANTFTPPCVLTP